ncbi:ABC transporter permease [Salinifilum aidingensis]
MAVLTRDPTGRLARGAPAGLVAAGRYAARPVVLAAVLTALYVHVSAQPLDLIEARSLNPDYILSRVVQHLLLSAAAASLILVIAIPAGVLLTRSWSRSLAAPLLTVANLGQAIPSIGLVVLLAVTFLSLGVNEIAIIAFVVYGILPVLRNTLAGLQQVDSAVIESARGMGMTRTAVLWKIELPLAVPVMLAGIRTALVITVGTVALATFVGAGGLGDIISNGINSNRNLVLVTGSALVAVLALLIDWLAGIAEEFLHPRGIRSGDHD